MTAALVHADALTGFDYGPEHPLRMERLGLVWRLMRAYGLTTLPGVIVEQPTPADEAAIAAFHSPKYLDVLKAADTGRAPSYASLYGLGPGDNPVFAGLWQVARLAAGGSITAAELVAAGRAERAFHFAGGLHHAMPARASGFCYVNDAVLAIMRLRARGMKVAYVDIDAHHGDGVQQAFYDDPSVLTISTHERPERLFPGTGYVEEVGEGRGAGFAVNLPLEAFTAPATYLPAFEAVVPPLLEAFQPDVVVLQLGIDAHRTDPLTHLALDIQAFAAAVRRIVALSPRLVALGGGGYDLRNVARAWTVAWAIIAGVDIPDEMPAAFDEDLARYGFTSRSLWDEPAAAPADLEPRVRGYAERQVEALRRLIFPTHRL